MAKWRWRDFLNDSEITDEGLRRSREGRECPMSSAARIFIKPAWRNHGGSWGLEHPLIYGKVPSIGWCIWHRHTGEITYISQAGTNAHGYEFGKDDCRKRSQPEEYGWVDQD